MNEEEKVRNKIELLFIDLTNKYSISFLDTKYGTKRLVNNTRCLRRL